MKPSAFSIFFYLAVASFCFSGAGVLWAEDSASAKEKLRSLSDQIIEADEKEDLPAALLAAEEAVRVAKEEIGPTSLKAADAMNNLANLYMIANRAPEAAKLYQQAILINVEKMDPNSTDMAEIYSNLGAAYAMQKKYKVAIDILRKARAIYLEKQGLAGEESKRTEEMITELTRIVYPEEERL